MIREPDLEKAIETIPIVVAPIQDRQQASPQILENLDEVMQTYNRENP